MFRHDLSFSIVKQPGDGSNSMTFLFIYFATATTKSVTSFKPDDFEYIQHQVTLCMRVSTNRNNLMHVSVPEL